MISYLEKLSSINTNKQLFPWTLNSDIDMVVSEIDNTIYLKDDKVKVCIKDKGKPLKWKEQLNQLERILYM